MPLTIVRSLSGGFYPTGLFPYLTDVITDKDLNTSEEVYDIPSGTSFKINYNGEKITLIADKSNFKSERYGNNLISGYYHEQDY